MADNMIDIGAGVATGQGMLNDIYQLNSSNYASATNGTQTNVRVADDFSTLIIIPPQNYTAPPKVTQPLTTSGVPWQPPVIAPTMRHQFVAVFKTRLRGATSTVDGDIVINANNCTVYSIGTSLTTVSDWPRGAIWTGTHYLKQPRLIGGIYRIAASSNGLDWTIMDVPSQASRITGYNGIWVLTVTNDGLYTSNNGGASWTKTGSYAVAYTSLGYGGGKFFASSNASVYSSVDNGASWTQTSVSTLLGSGFLAYGLIYDGTRFCGVGYNSTASAGGKFMYSSDMVSWTAVTVTPRDRWRFVTFNGNVHTLRSTDHTDGHLSSSNLSTWGWVDSSYNTAHYSLGTDFYFQSTSSYYRKSVNNGVTFTGYSFTNTTPSISITQADIDTINKRMVPGEPFFYFAGSAQDPDRELAFSNITFLDGVGSGFSELTVNALINRAVYRNGVLLGLITSNTATTITLANLTYTNSVPGNVIIAYPSAEVEQLGGVTWLNGVGSGFSYLVPNSLVGKAVYRNGVLLGIITSNTDTTVTISDLTYTNGTPGSVAIMSILITSYHGRLNLLAQGAVDELTAPPIIGFNVRAATDMLTAPPLSCIYTVATMERTSTTEISVYSSGQVAHMGLPFTSLG